MNKILIVDDDVIIGMALSKLLKKEGYKTKLAETGKAAQSAVDAFSPQLILLDFELPDMNGFEILKKIKQTNNDIIVIMITSFADVRKAVQAMKLGAYNFFSKPFDKGEIISVVKKAFSTLKKDELISENISETMGVSKPLREVLKNIERVADKDITVFLEGETGTGKELFARMIHNKSLRRDKPFIAVDCGAIPENLFESELFGHKKGAFTGALAALGGSAGTDVTGGMRSKVRGMLDLAVEIPGLEILIFGGDPPGNVSAALLGERIGTRIAASSSQSAVRRKKR